MFLDAYAITNYGICNWKILMNILIKCTKSRWKCKFKAIGFQQVFKSTSPDIYGNFRQDK